MLSSAHCIVQPSQLACLLGLSPGSFRRRSASFCYWVEQLGFVSLLEKNGAQVEGAGGGARLEAGCSSSAVALLKGERKIYDAICQLKDGWRYPDCELCV